MQSLLLLLKSAQFGYFVCLIRCTIKFIHCLTLQLRHRNILANMYTICGYDI